MSTNKDLEFASRIVAHLKEHDPNDDVSDGRSARIIGAGLHEARGRAVDEIVARFREVGDDKAAELTESWRSQLGW